MSQRQRVVLLAVSIAGAAGCRPHRVPDFPVDAAEREAVVHDVLRELDDKYVFPEVAARNRPLLEERWSAPGFRGLTSGLAVAQTMTRDLRELYHDKHLGVLPARAVPSSMLGPDHAPTPEELAEERELAARTSFGIPRREVLDGNIGYLEIVELPAVQVPEVGKAIEDAMATVAESDALIIDVRRNRGGDGDTVALLVSYLLDEKKLLLVAHDRTTGKTAEDWSRETVPGRRYGARRPVWVLTSARTFSAGEELAYDLKTLGRATIVGEPTGGAANHNMFVRVGPSFVLSVAYGWVESPITGTNWEGTGVQPDVEVPADRALDAALAAVHEVARQSL